MTKLIIDLSDVAGETHPEDTVVVWSPVHREGSAGRTVSPTQHTIRLTDGVGESEVEPGPLMVQTHVRAIADTRPKEVVVPDQASVTLWELLEQRFIYAPQIVNRALQAIIDALEDALAQVGGAVGDAVEDIKWHRGTLASDSQLDLMTAESYMGLWRVELTSIATALNLPTKEPGTLTVKWVSGVNTTSTIHTWEGVSGASWVRTRILGMWGSWTPDQAAERARIIPSGTDWNTITQSGWHRRNLPRTTDLNAPTTATANLFVADPGHSAGLVTQLVLAGSDQGIWFRSETLSGFSDWARLDQPAPPPDDPGSSYNKAVQEGAARREFLISDLMDRKGGTIGTAGKAAVAFRFDHHTDQFRRLILPLLESRGIPWAQALNSRTQGVGNNLMTWAELQQSALNTGGEVFNHGATHNDAQTRAQLEDEIISSLSELRGHLPHLPIDGWMQPGTGGSFGGLQPFRTEDNWTTEAGRMLTAYHPIVYGYKAGLMKMLDGRPSIGQNHLSMDTMSSAEVKAEVDRAVATGSGVVLMLHPNFLEDTTGNYMSLAEFTEVVDYVSGLRGSGSAEIVSASGLQLCDGSHSRRRHLIDLDISGGYGLAGQRLANRYTFAADGVHELHGTVDSTGDVTVEIFTPDLALNYSRILTGTGVREVWLPFVIPVGASDISVRVTGADSGNVHVRAV